MSDTRIFPNTPAASTLALGASAPLLPPPRVPDHELLRRIGRGAYGEVWLARSTATGAFRAVKVVHRQSFDHDRPFEREFEGILKFEPVSRRHDSQVDILHVGRGDGCFYYVMELADDQATGGQINPDHYLPRTLKSDVQFHGRIMFEECVRIGVALATALEHLHTHGLVHRDVKPSNIIFVNGVPKLADIGLVTGVDATRSYVGTEGFAAPEGPGTPQADLYSLGKVLYEISTGKDRQEFPELPTQLRELPDREGLVELNAVIARACRHDPKDRYPSAAMMRADLELLQAGRSLARLHRVRERLRFVSRAGALVTALALLILAGWLYQAHQTRSVHQLAVEKTHLADEMSKLAAADRERLVRLKVANGIREMDQGELASALVWLAEALALTTNNPADAAIQRIRINQLLAEHPRLLNVFPHPANVQAAEFSPDERRVVTACVDGKIRIWDTEHDEKPVAEFVQEGPVGRVRFTRDDRHLLVLQMNQMNQPAAVKLLDAATGKPVLAPIEDVTCAALSPDDRWLAVARTNFVVQVIAADTGQIAAEAAGHENQVEMVEFSPDSSQLITASRDRTVRRWSVSTGKPIGSALRHDQPVKGAIFNHDATRIATVTSSEASDEPIEFQTWDAATAAALGKPILGLGLHSVLAFDRSGRRLLTGDREALLRVWDADSHVAIAPPLRMDGGVRTLDLSPDGAYVALGSESGSTRVWELESGRTVFPPLRNSGKTEFVRFNGVGNLLLVAGDDGTVKLWDLAHAPADNSTHIHSRERPAPAVSPDGRQLLLGTVDVQTRIRLIELDRLNEMPFGIPFADKLFPGYLTFDRRGDQWAAVTGPTDYIELLPQFRSVGVEGGLWRREESRIRYFPLNHEGRSRRVFFRTDGAQVLTVGDDRTARIWNTSDGKPLRTIRWPEEDISWVAVSPDFGTAIALCRDSKGRHICFRDVPTCKQLGQPPETNPDINAATFSPDGTRVATAGDNQCGRIWDARGQPVTPYFKHGGNLTCVAWSPDGRRVLTAGASPEVKVWDARTGELALPPLLIKTKSVRGTRFSPDGRFIVAHSDEDLVRVWDAATGEAITPLLPHPDSLVDVFVTAAQHLVTAQNSGVIRVWDLTEGSRSAPDQLDYARLLAWASPAPPDSGGTAGSEELAARFRSLRSRQPDFFSASSDRLREWHRRSAYQPDTLGQTEAAIFHLERLAQLAPDDATLTEQLSRCRRALIRAREPGTPPQLLDLTRAYTHSLDLRPGGEFAELPRGRQRLGGIEFDVRGMIQLDHRSEREGQAGPFHPSAVIRVGQRCRTLHFLHATEGNPRVEGSTVGRWIIQYADGSVREWPVIYGEDVRDWRWWEGFESLEAKRAPLAWRGAALNWPDTWMRLFKASWTNPQPDVEISSLEYRIGETGMKPFVVAVTAD